MKEIYQILIIEISGAIYPEFHGFFLLTDDVS